MASSRYSNAVVRRIVLAGIVAFCFSLSACKDDTGKSFTIGIVSAVPFRDTVLEGFKSGMAELKNMEGREVIYLCNADLEYRSDAVDKEISGLMAQKVDILLTIGNMPAMRAKQAVEGTDVPVVFAAISNPVGEGLVESISHPGGNLTGAQVGLEVPKALEWMATIVPNARKVFLPYNPNDPVSVMFLKLLAPYALQLDIELVPAEVHSVEETVAAIGYLSPEISAIFRIPSPTLDIRNNELSRAAIDANLPMVAGHPLDEDVLLTFSSDLLDVGKRSARIACQILDGIKPADLPVETAEVRMVVNLKTAMAIGLNIPDMILRQADQVIR
jgi:putative ABC transport system substrate-binding protein